MVHRKRIRSSSTEAAFRRRRAVAERIGGRRKRGEAIYRRGGRTIYPFEVRGSRGCEGRGIVLENIGGRTRAMKQGEEEEKGGTDAWSRTPVQCRFRLKRVDNFPHIVSL